MTRRRKTQPAGGDPRDTGILNHPPNRCLLCDGIRRDRFGLPQTGGRPAAPLPDDIDERPAQ